MGTLSVGSFVITTDSLTLDQLTDVTATSTTHNDIIVYNDSAQDGAYTDGWHSKPFTIESLGNVNSATIPTHNEIMAWNDNSTDPAYATGWVNKNITTVFSSLETTVKSIVNIQTSKTTATSGNPAKTDQFMYTATNGSGGFNLSIASCGDNNRVLKKEVSDPDFIFIQSMSLGEIANLNYTKGTILRSDKGIAGFTGPFPVPLGLSSMGIKNARFYISSASSDIEVVSMGTEVEVNLYQSDGVTLEAGPVTITAYNTATLSIVGAGEYYILSSGFISCGIVETGSTNKRPIVPMTTELIGYNRNIFITAQETSTTVTYHRRNNTTGTIAVSAGTSVDGTGDLGSNADFAVGGGIILRSDKPISARSENDSAGSQSIPLWPIGQLAQCFPIPSTISTNVDYGVACIAICSPYEGTANIFDSTGTLVTSFNFNRTGVLSPATSVSDQLYPAVARWAPNDETVPTDLTGGFVQTNVPVLCVMNFDGSTVWTSDSGNEIIIPGSTPDELRAEIKLDAGGLKRRRDLDNTGVVTWTVC